MNPCQQLSAAFAERAPRKASINGFTLLELMIIIGSLAVLLIVLTPALARVKPNGLAIQCLNNTRQLARAWQLYAGDNNDRLVINLHGAASIGGAGDSTYGASWVSGWQDWTTSSDNTNVALINNPRFARLAPYLRQDTNVVKCPADKFVSAVQVARGFTRRVRSYSANLYVGAGNVEAGPGDPLYRHVTKMSDLRFPTPAQTFVFVDEHPDSINDPGFFPPHQTAWVDYPTTYHNGAAAFSFVDGHSEMHKWAASLRKLSVVELNSAIVVTASSGDADLHWASFHSPRSGTASY